MRRTRRNISSVVQQVRKERSMKKVSKRSFDPSKPIIISRIPDQQKGKSALRQAVYRLLKKGKAKRLCCGAYLLSETNEGYFQSSDVRKFLNQKYLLANNKVKGYFSGLSFANGVLHVSSQVPSVLQIVSNEVKRSGIRIQIGNIRCVLNKPKVKVTSSNYKILQLLDYLSDDESLSELSKEEERQIIISYIKKEGLSLKALSQVIEKYPKKVFLKLLEMGYIYEFARRQKAVPVAS
jgi:hypothetical protein